jgi:hypothetical protein
MLRFTIRRGAHFCERYLEHVARCAQIGQSGDEAVRNNLPVSLVCACRVLGD